jgi:hypothetical protein
MVVVNHVSQSSLGVCINLAITFFTQIFCKLKCVYIFLGPSVYIYIYIYGRNSVFKGLNGTQADDPTIQSS